jgi:Neutral/alkaline non-lysosomal ceramidase, N-terminal
MVRTASYGYSVAPDKDYHDATLSLSYSRTCAAKILCVTANTLRAGAATIDITPPIGVRMDGYGARRQPCRGAHDPLFARALVLEQGDLRCATVSCDLLGMHPYVTLEVRHLAAKRSRISPDGLVLCATHSHAGPAGLRGGMFSRLDQALAGTLAQRVCAAIDGAASALQPATLKLGRATIDTVSMNRRHPDGPIDPDLLVLLVDGESSPIATALNFACHATVLSGENLMLSTEFPGAACRLLQQQTGAPALYLQGACANINPVWTKQDFDSVERAGQIVGGTALRIVAELRALGPGQRAHNIRWDEFTEKPVPGRIVQPHLRATRREIDIPVRDFLADEEYAARIESLETEATELPEASDERRNVIAQRTRFQNERWAATWAGRRPEQGAQKTEIQALSLGDDLALLALPGEFFVETADAIRHGSAVEDLLVACYANDYIGYVVPPAAYDEGGYEAGITSCTPEAEAMFIDALLDLLAHVTSRK